ncbi:MAG: PorT family protein [Calditrichaceae bacterium]|nr:PorT family protein [Calditrichaceae bacterium]MBN2708983.1 PorT family protein [Calditrichaceae bacterium]
MKNHVFLVSVLIFFFSLLTLINAQTTQIGIMGGANIANLDEEGSSFDSRSGFGAGFIIDVPLGENYSICFEPMYLQKGASQEENGLKLEMNYTYGELPVLFKYQYGENLFGLIRPYLKGGFIIGINIDSKMKFSYQNASEEIDIAYMTETFDYGLTVGGGISFALGENSIFIDARYNYGLADIFKGGGIALGSWLPIENTKITTNGIQVMLGVTLPFGGK